MSCTMEKTLYPSRLKSLVFLLLCLIGARLCVGTSGLLTIASLGGAAIFAASFLPGATWLTLDDQGFTYCSLFRQHRTRWVDVGSILVVTQCYLGFIPVNRMVGWTYAKSYKRSVLLKASSALAGFDALLPNTYGMKARDLAAFMEAWRQRAVEGHRAA